MGDDYNMPHPFSIKLVSNGLQLMYVRVITTMSIFDMSNNSFVGHIPDAIGRLHSLRQLNLSYNLLTSNIPPLIGELSLLDGLDLSSNRLTGHIPQELVSLINSPERYLRASELVLVFKFYCLIRTSSLEGSLWR